MFNLQLLFLVWLFHLLVLFLLMDLISSAFTQKISIVISWRGRFCSIYCFFFLWVSFFCLFLLLYWKHSSNAWTLIIHVCSRWSLLLLKRKVLIESWLEYLHGNVQASWVLGSTQGQWSHKLSSSLGDPSISVWEGDLSLVQRIS